MPPRKNRPLLFELVARTQRARGRSAVPPSAAPSAAPWSPAPTPAPTVAPFPRPLSDVSRRLGGLHVANGRIHFALTWPQAAVVGISLLVLLVVVFQVGRRSKEPLNPRRATLEDILSGTTVTETPPTAAPPPTPGHGRSVNPVATPLPQPSEDAAAAKPPVREPPPRRVPPPERPAQAEPPEAFTPVADSYYIVVQHFRLRDQQRAEAAQEFLRSRGVPCAIRTGADLQLVATEPFSSEQQAETLRRRIVEVGKEYRESGGYDFASARARKF